MNFFIPAQEFALDFIGADGNRVGDQLMELFLQHLVTQILLKLRNLHADPVFYFGGVLVFQPNVAVPGGGENLLNAIGKFVVGNLNSHALRLDFQRLLEDHLIQNLFGVKTAEGVGH